MSRVDYMTNSTGSISSLWQQLQQRENHYSRQAETINYYCFYEGSDDCKYYNPKFKEKNITISHFDCKGKFNLLKFKKFMDEKYGRNDLLYFIDKDYDDKIKPTYFQTYSLEDKLYVTPCYSIENFYTIEEVYKELLLNEYGYSIDSNEYTELLTKFNLMKSKFHAYIEDINIWYATYKYFFDKKEITEEISMNSFPLNKFIKINVVDEKIEEKKPLLEELKKSIKSTPINFNIEFLTIKSKFTSPCCEFRGKMEIFFMNKFIENINMTKQYKVFPILQNNILSNIVQYSKKPICLDAFLNQL